mmetsp:Transcript_25849/g.61242  ORF Transcript_25849/g.61242 Transcript_25849/m.61242 type:complete len:777 (+) Transcript_25849:2560-4890(+)
MDSRRQCQWKHPQSHHPSIDSWESSVGRTAAHEKFDTTYDEDRVENERARMVFGNGDDDGHCMMQPLDAFTFPGGANADAETSSNTDADTNTQNVASVSSNIDDFYRQHQKNKIGTCRTNSRRRTHHRNKYHIRHHAAELWILFGIVTNIFVIFSTVQVYHFNQRHQQELLIDGNPPASSSLLLLQRHNEEQVEKDNVVTQQQRVLVVNQSASARREQHQNRPNSQNRDKATATPQGLCPPNMSDRDHHRHQNEDQTYIDNLAASSKSKAEADHTRPVFLWGIPSTMSFIEQKRRNVIRETYLSPIGMAETSRKTICSIQEWTCSPTTSKIRNDCQIIYFFFVGANPDPNALTENLLLNSSTNSIDSDFTSLLLTREQEQGAIQKLRQADHYQHDASDSNPANDTVVGAAATDNDTATAWKSCLDQQQVETGLVCANIRENQMDGKITTMFKFASLVATAFSKQPLNVDGGGKTSSERARQPYTIDYIAKVDSDLLLFTPSFLGFMHEKHVEILNKQQKHQQRQQDRPQSSVISTQVPSFVYGGIEFPATNCKPDDVDKHTTKHGGESDHPCPLPLVGPSYMSGELNFMSVDLASYITCDRCPRSNITIRQHEDVSMSNYVYSFLHQQDEPSSAAIEVVSIDPSKILRTMDSTAAPATTTNHKNSIQDDKTNNQVETLIDFRRRPYQLIDNRFLWGHSPMMWPPTHRIWKDPEECSKIWSFFTHFYDSRTKQQQRKQPPPSQPTEDTFMSRRYGGPWPGEKYDRMARNAVLNNLLQ